jgi:NAD(P)H-hydrate repair Nnr-like enzyme with NAD(P)H-hydrate dehydratase domain
MKDITPAKFKCSLSMACPSVHKSDDGKTYIIVGRFVDKDDHTGEATIEISAELLEGAIRSQINDK